MEISEFLAARLDEREAGADDFHDARRCGSLDRDGGFESDRCDCGHPARVLRDVEAGREILAEYSASPAYGPDYGGGYSAGLEFAIRCLAEAGDDKEGQP
jgi:hypothetical protein